MKNFVTGAAGFIGSTLVDRLLDDGHDVIGYDNLSTGQHAFLERAHRNERFSFVEGDTLDLERLTAAMKSCERVFHFAANADVRFGLDDPSRDLQQNTVATFNVLEAMRVNCCKTIVFSSTGSVYGEAAVIPTPEDAPFPIQTSLYGASKLAGEGLIEAYCEGYAFEGYIFRFVSILGERYTHGHVYDFYRQLIEYPTRLRVLGDGSQRKSYLYVQDCVNAILLLVNNGTSRDPLGRRVQIYNLGTNETCQVLDSISWICNHLGLTPRLEFTGGDRGWVGDNPHIFLDITKARASGWEPKLRIREGIVRTVEWLQKNQWCLSQT
jgi:UDP-glucose 4-epimerase